MKFSLKLLTLWFCGSMFSSCEKEIPKEILYSNSFQNSEAISDFTITNLGSFKFQENDGAPSSPGCLYVDGLCGDTPIVYKEFGPFSKNVTISVETYLKSDHGAIVYITMKKYQSDKTSLSTSKDLEVCRQWHKYESDELFVPKGEVITVWLDAGHSYFNRTWIDDLKLYAH